jgi:hypothetical protein
MAYGHASEAALNLEFRAEGWKAFRDGVRALMIYGDSSVGRDIPSKAKGRATVQIGDGEPIECQAYWIADASDADPNYTNTAEDWATLLRLGMPASMLPDNFKEMVPSG